MGSKKKRKPYTPPDYAAMQGDWGPNTPAQRAGTEIVLLEGDNPNRVAYRRRGIVIDRMAKSGALSQRQWQAATEIQMAYLACEMLSSGGPLKAKVDASPNFGKTIAIQADAQSRLNRAMKRVPADQRRVVEHVCWHNRPIADLDQGRAFGVLAAGLLIALDLVADYLGY